MGYKIKALNVQSPSGVTTGQLFFVHEDPAAGRLLVILPGRGYTRDDPLLYYLRMVAVPLGYDVLAVQYSFQADPHAVSFDRLGWDGLGAEVEQLVKALPEREYEQVCMAGKSLGTPLAVQLAQKHPARHKSTLLLTPIANAVQLAGDLPTLAIIGTGDAAYNQEIVEADTRRENVTWWVFDGLNHSLEHRDDWQASMEVLQEIMEICESFLR